MRGAQRAAALTHRLLAFSRRQPLEPKLLDVNKYLPGIAEFLQRASTSIGHRAGAPTTSIWIISVRHCVSGVDREVDESRFELRQWLEGAAEHLLRHPGPVSLTAMSRYWLGAISWFTRAYP
jgi:hypothetical protein